ncbi:MAG: Lrp/AsnC family transcriptional regulator, partial [Clostridia bacterium]|nr:Lrp/AsnC family transcriptional regulator [Clostridia bacterium]
MNVAFCCMFCEQTVTISNSFFVTGLCGLFSCIWPETRLYWKLEFCFLKGVPFMQSLQMQLLQLLQEDCRLTLEQLATMTGSSVEAVGTMIDDMEKSGVILRYAPVINWDKT